MRLSLRLLTLTFAVIPTASAQVKYYVERHGEITPMKEGDPGREHPDEWGIRLYKPGAAASGPRWGEIIGQSADDAQEELRRSRVFEERLQRFCGGDSQNEMSRYANVLGPIAVYRLPRPVEAKTGQFGRKGGPEPAQIEVFDLADRMSELEKDFLVVTEETRVQAHPSRYPFAPGSAPWTFAMKLAETKREFEKSNALASSGGLSFTSDARLRVNNALGELETNLLPAMRKALANAGFEGRWKHHGISYVSVRSGKQLSLEADTPEGLHFRNINIDNDTALSGEIEFVYDNGCEPVWAPFTAELTFDTDAEGILITVPRVGRETATCHEVTQGALRMMFWRPEP